MTKLDASAPTTRPNATGETTMLEPDSATPTPPAYAAELAALRARLREVEAALGLPLRPGQPPPPDLPALRRRVAALERRLGVVPGLVPLPGCDDAAAPARATTIAAEPAGREQAWRERGRAAPERAAPKLSTASASAADPSTAANAVSYPDRTLTNLATGPKSPATL